MRELEHSIRFWAAVIPTGGVTKYLANRHWQRHAFHYTEKLNKAQLFDDRQRAVEYLNGFEYTSGYELVPVTKLFSVEMENQTIK